jgi:hypothetical protein
MSETASGRDAWKSGKAKSNPHPAGSKANGEWQRGYDAEAKVAEKSAKGSTKDDATDAALRSLSMLRDELTKVRAEQRKVQGPEKWTYDDYIREINAKIDKLQAVAARADAEPNPSASIARLKKELIGEEDPDRITTIKKRIREYEKIVNSGKADSETTAGVVKGIAEKPGIGPRPDAALRSWTVTLSKGDDRKEHRVRATNEQDAVRIAHERMGDKEAGKWKTVNSFRNDAVKPDGEKLRKILDRTDSLKARADAADPEYWVIDYRNKESPNDNKNGSKRYSSEKAAKEEANRGNRIDKVGGVYSVRHVAARGDSTDTKVKARVGLRIGADAEPADIDKEYKQLKAASRQYLEGEVKRNHRIYDTKGSSKSDLISQILNDKFSRKDLDAWGK